MIPFFTRFRCNRFGRTFRPILLRAFALPIISIGLSFLFGCSIAIDQKDAEVVAARVHEAILSEDFAAIYNESAPQFRSVGSESEFVAGLNQLKKRLGRLKAQSEIAYQTNLDAKIGRTHVLTFDLEFELGRARESMMFVRSASGKMELWRIDIQPV